jgi:hypothetical protein
MARNDYKLQAELITAECIKRGVDVPRLLDAVPELGYERDQLCIVNRPCEVCGSIYAVDGGASHHPEAGEVETRETGSSLRLVATDPADIPGTTVTQWDIVCASGSPDCKTTLTRSTILEQTLATLGAKKFVERVSPLVPGDFLPRLSTWYFLCRATDPTRRAVFSKGSPNAALAELTPGAGVKVLLQTAEGYTGKHAATFLKTDAWETRMTSKTGNLEGTKDFEKERQDELDRLAAEKREIEIRREVVEFERELRRTKH